MKQNVVLTASRWEDGSGWSYTNDILSIDDAIEGANVCEGELIVCYVDLAEMFDWDNYEPLVGHDILYRFQLIAVDDDDEETVLNEYECWESELAERYYNE